MDLDGKVDMLQMVGNIGKVLVLQQEGNKVIKIVAKHISYHQCVENCNDGNQANYAYDIIKGSSVYSISGEKNIIQDIYDNGSVEASFTIYEDFVTYSNGIYQHITGSSLGGHDVKIIVWEIENNVKNWLCVYSWNNEWGDKGFFKILRGSNEYGIEGINVPVVHFLHGFRLK